ncbi:MAG: ImmA/IrrE family metallo-endopeptidase [Bryobacterales bacterium]|nr:ImmA/IrrE family metallo-endopeptidase [Bryobacterales bacterium]
MPRTLEISKAEEEQTRSLLDRLLEDSRLYKSSKEFRDLLDFTVRLRNFAPFNAMLLQIQKPGLGFAATAEDWFHRFDRTLKEGARPLLILWPFGPVALVYDFLDTLGEREPPRDAFAFPTEGSLAPGQIGEFSKRLESKHIHVFRLDAGDQSAGWIRVENRATDQRKEYSHYGLGLNANHTPAAQFCTIAHELAHLFLGHLGPDPKLSVPQRPYRDHALIEIEAESVAYIVCWRQGIRPASQTYLANFVNADVSTAGLDLYQIMRAAGQVETLLGLAARARNGAM